MKEQNNQHAMKTSRKESIENMYNCIVSIWEDIHSGRTSYEGLSIGKYSEKYHVGTFAKEMIKEIAESPERPDLEDAIELKKRINLRIRFCKKKHGSERSGYRDTGEGLSLLTDRQLIQELRKRGYCGELKNTVKIEI